MNIIHLRYVCEIAKTKSISQAAENLFMSQPNLSRAIKELESSLNIEIFERTPKGMKLTTKGEEFLIYAKRILNEIDEIENLYTGKEKKKVRFAISVPRVSYIAQAFTNFSKNLQVDCKCEIYYKETNSLRAIRNILSSHYNLGIIRYQSKFDSYYQMMLKDKLLEAEEILEFTPLVIMSKNHVLADKNIKEADLLNYVEIAHADPYVPDLPMSEVKRIELPETINKRIFVFERASQFSLLETVSSTYMWVSNVPRELLDKYHLVQKPVSDVTRKYRDVLIYKKGYRLQEIERDFLEELNKQKQIILAKTGA